MKIIVKKDYEEVSDEVTKIVADHVRKKPDLVFCLPAGASPVGMYKRLIDMYNNHELDFSQMYAFDFDEYLGLGPDNENSYAYFMREHFLKYVNVKKENIHYPDALAEDADKAAREYAQLIIDHGGFDIGITGIGDDGHIGYNEPNSYHIAKTHTVALSDITKNQNKKYFDNDVSKMPNRAVTIGMEEIMKTKHFIVLSSGANKAHLLGKLFAEEKIDPMYPVSFLYMHPNTTFIIDEPAAAQIPQTVLDYYK